MPTSSWFGLVVWLFYTPQPIGEFLASINWYAMGIAFLAPALMLVVRHEIRLGRLRSILDFIKNFNLSGLRQTTPSTAPSKARLNVSKVPLETGTLSGDDENGYGENPSFEYVKSKYISDLNISIGSDDFARLDAARTDKDRIEIYIDIAGRPFSNISYRLYLASIGFMLVSYQGFKTLFLAFGYGSSASCDPTGGCGLSPYYAVGAFAFAGAFVVAVRMLLRRLAVFDLSAFSFLWHSIEMIATVLIVVMLYNAFPDPWGGVEKAGQAAITTAAKVKDAVTGEPTKKTDPTTTSAISNTAAPSDADGKKEAPIGQIPLIWLALAPALGLLPQSATTFLLSKMRNKISWWKTADDRFANVTQSVTLDIIDGIDFETRFRLEESGIYNVQNLATYNPIMLFVETPYGIYQCIDWIAQAQLCHILGPEKFLLFREMNMRTIFDLERAIDSIYSPDAYDSICAAILFSPTGSLNLVVSDTGFKFALMDKGVTKLADTQEYFRWVHEQLAIDGTVKAVEHLSAWISDDLHVRRLRRLWNDICESLEPNSEYLKDSKRNPENKRKMEEMAAAKAEQQAAKARAAAQAAEAAKASVAVADPA